MQLPDGQVGFVGKDVAEVLGYSNASKAVKMHVDEEDMMPLMVESPTDAQNGNLWRMSKTTFINESGLYSLILSSKLPKAREFKHWVTSEVLPQIRQTGGYIPVKEEDDEKAILAKAVQILQKTVEQKQSIIEMRELEIKNQDRELEMRELEIKNQDRELELRELEIENQNRELELRELEIESQDHELKMQRPMVEFAQAVSQSEDTCTIAELAKLLYKRAMVEVGQNRLFQWLRDNHFLCISAHHRNEPFQKWIESGYFKLKTSEPWYDANGMSHYRVTPMVTGKGQEFFVKGFLSGKFSI